MTSVMGNAQKTAEYVAECTRYGIRILPPDINESTADFRAIVNGEERYIRFGLLALKNLGVGFIDRIAAERSGRSFTSFEDFVERMYGQDMNKRQIEALIKSGAFDGLGVFRSKLLLSYERIIDHYQERSRSNVAGQLDLFSMGLEDVPAKSESFDYPEVAELTLREKLRLEKECSGIYFSGHMIEDYSRHVDKISPIAINSILSAFSDEDEAEETFADKQTVTLCGIITRRQTKMTKNGAQMAFISLEDRFGELEVLIFPKTFETVSHMITNEAAICVVGQLSVRDDEDPKVLAQDILPLDDNEHFSERSAMPQTRRVSQRGGYERSQPMREHINSSQATSAAEQIAHTVTQTATKAGGGTVYHVRGVSAPPPAAVVPPASVPAYKPPQNGVGRTPTQGAMTVKPSKVYLRVEHTNASDRLFKKAENLVYIFCDGVTEVIFYDKSTSEYKRLSGVRLAASPFVINELRLVLGDDNVVVK